MSSCFCRSILPGFNGGDVVLHMTDGQSCAANHLLLLPYLHWLDSLALTVSFPRIYCNMFGSNLLHLSSQTSSWHSLQFSYTCTSVSQLVFFPPEDPIQNVPLWLPLFYCHFRLELASCWVFVHPHHQKHNGARQRKMNQETPTFPKDSNQQVCYNPQLHGQKLNVLKHIDQICSD